MNSRVNVRVIMVLGVFAISGAAILIRQAQAEPIAIAFYRMAFAAVLMVPWAVYDLRQARLTAASWRVLVLAGFFLALHFALWNTSLFYTSVTSSVVLVTTQPVFVTVFGALLLGEIPTRRAWVGLALAISGSAVVALGGNSEGASRLAGNVMALGGAIMAAGYFLVGRVARRTIPVGLYGASVYGCSALFLLIAALIFRQPLTGYSGDTWRSLFLLALVSTVLGHTSLNWALKYLPTSMVSVSILGEPLGATILAVILLQELPALLEVFGGILIIAGILMIWQQGSAQDPQESEAGGTEKASS
ncbi:MAG: DMT family transporter [Limnochordia bacterium]